MKKFFIAILGALMLTSCSTRLLDFTLISSKNVDLSKASKYVKGQNRVKGDDVVHIILIIPTGIPNLKEALDKAIESVPGCVALLDGVIYEKGWYILLYGQSGFVVEGTPLIDTTIANNSEIAPYNKVELDRNGNVKSVVQITQEEYQKYKKKFAK